MRRYHIQDREDYHKSVESLLRLESSSCGLPRYNKLCGSLRSLIHKISLLPAADPYRQRKEGEMLDKLYDMGILGEQETYPLTALEKLLC